MSSSRPSPGRVWSERLERVLDEPDDDGRPRRLEFRRLYADALLQVVSDGGQDHHATRPAWEARCRELMGEIAAWAGIDPPPQDYYIAKRLRDR